MELERPTNLLLGTTVNVETPSDQCGPATFHGILPATPFSTQPTVEIAGPQNVSNSTAGNNVVTVQSMANGLQTKSLKLLKWESGSVL